MSGDQVSAPPGSRANPSRPAQLQGGGNSKESFGVQSVVGVAPPPVSQSTTSRQPTLPSPGQDRTGQDRTRPRHHASARPAGGGRGLFLPTPKATGSPGRGAKAWPQFPSGFIDGVSLLPRQAAPGSCPKNPSWLPRKTCLNSRPVRPRPTLQSPTRGRGAPPRGAPSQRPGPPPAPWQDCFSPRSPPRSHLQAIRLLLLVLRDAHPPLSHVLNPERTNHPLAPLRRWEGKGKAKHQS